MPTIGTIGVSPTVCSILLQKQQGLIGLTPDEVRIASNRVKLNIRTALVPFCGICKYYHGGGHVSFFKRGSMFNADVTICKQLRYTSCGRGKAKWRGRKGLSFPAVLELVLCCVSFCRFAIQLSDDIFMVFRALTHTVSNWKSSSLGQGKRCRCRCRRRRLRLSPKLSIHIL